MLFHQACKKIVGAHVMISVGAGLQITAQLPNDCLMVALQGWQSSRTPWDSGPRCSLSLAWWENSFIVPNARSVKSAPAFRNLIDDFTELGILLLKELVQVVELRSGDVPMVVRVLV